MFEAMDILCVYPANFTITSVHKVLITTYFDLSLEKNTITVYLYNNY